MLRSSARIRYRSSAGSISLRRSESRAIGDGRRPRPRTRDHHGVAASADRRRAASLAPRCSPSVLAVLTTRSRFHVVDHHFTGHDKMTRQTLFSVNLVRARDIERFGETVQSLVILSFSIGHEHELAVVDLRYWAFWRFPHPARRRSSNHPTVLLHVCSEGSLTQTVESLALGPQVVGVPE